MKLVHLMYRELEKKSTYTRVEEEKRKPQAILFGSPSWSVISEISVPKEVLRKMQPHELFM